MFDWIKRHRFALSVSLTIVGSLLFLSQPGSQTSHSAVRSLTQTLTYPFQWVTHSTVDFVKDLISSYIDLVETHEENELLKRQISSLEEELGQYIEESIQFHRLKNQLEFAERFPEEYVFAEVIGESIDNLHQTLMINRGALHGVQRNDPVVLKEGVVGRVQTVSPLQSSVLLIADQQSRFPAMSQRTRVKGLVYGTHSGIELRRVHQRADIRVGDRIITNGLSGLFPKGIMAGKVESVTHDENSLFQTARLTPIVNFDKIEWVFVILKNTSSREKMLTKQ